MDVNVIMRASRVYKLILERCYNPKMTGYKDYGGRGIYMSEEWLNNPTDFFNWYRENFFNDCQINRIDNNGPYSKDNCKLVTATENSRNRRNTRNYEAFGESKNLAAWAEDHRCGEKDWRNIDRRIRLGATLEEAMDANYKSIRYEKSSKTQRNIAPPITAFGESKSLADWSEDNKCQVSKGTLWYRLSNGWDTEKAIATPARRVRQEA